MRIIKRTKNLIKTLRLNHTSRKTLAKNKKLEDSKAGKRCFILGTGPSIKEQEILRLKNEETFVVNAFWNYPQYEELNPKYYVFTDSNAFPEQRDKNTYWKKQFIDHAPLISSLPTRFFFHINAKLFIEPNHLFPLDRVFYLTFDRFFKENLKFNIKINRPIPYTKNVIIACIIIAAHMGFEEIYLLGCEHDFLAHLKNYNFLNHFYANEVIPEAAPQKTESYEELIRNAAILFSNYRILKNKLAKEKPKIQIFNATPNSFLDVFPYTKYEDIKI